MKQHTSKFQKILACMLIVTLLCILCSCSKQSTGTWQQVAKKDEFGDEIKDATYCSIDAEGTFSKPDVTEGKLQATVCAAKDAVWIVLHEDVNSVVTNTAEETVHYTVSIKNDAGEVYQFDGRMGTESEKISFGLLWDWDFNTDECIQLLTHLCGNGSLKFSIVNENNKLIKYNFTIPCDQRADGVTALAAQWYVKAEEYLSIENFDRAEMLFGLLGKYKDSSDRVLGVQYARAESWLSSNEYDKAEEAFTALGSYKDAAKRVLDVQEARNADAYAEAEKLLTNKNYDRAEEAFMALGDYRDAAQRVLDVQEARNADKYAKAEALLAEKNYDAAENAFAALEDYSDSAQRVVDVQNARNAEKYTAAEALLTEKNYDAAEKAFAALGDYSDSVQRVVDVQNARNAERYAVAEALLVEKNYDAAEKAFIALGEYNDSATRAISVREIQYNEAVALKESERYEEAIEAFIALNGYMDSAVQIQESYYLQARLLASNGDYIKAYAIYRKIYGYKDVENLLINNDKLAAIAADIAAREAKYAIGNYVNFGSYEQDGNTSNGQEPVIWYVLDKRGSNVLLLSKYGLDAMPYNTQKATITWEECSLRHWLNSDFLNTAFTEEDQAAILLTNVDNSAEQGYSEWSTTGGKNTQDKIFLLSYAEARQYFNISEHMNIQSRIEPTAFAVKNGASTALAYRTEDDKASGWWWLRSPGYAQNRAAYVEGDGSLSNFVGMDDDSACVRPVLWIDLDALFF